MKKRLNNTSPYRNAATFGRMDYVKITIFGFALSALWSSLHTVILPLRLLDFVPQELKNTYLDLLILSGLLLAMIVQPFAGALSDRSTFSWGRRRPYILLGTILALVFLPGIGFFSSYGAILLTYCLLQISVNLAQGSFQGFIPDLVSEERRGLASGVRGLLNIAGGVILVRLVTPLMDRYFIGEGNLWLWLALGTVALVLLGAMLATVLIVPERTGTSRTPLPLLSTLSRSFRIDLKARPDFILFLVSCFLIFAAWGILLAHALYYLMDVIGLASPAEAIGDFLVAAGAGMLVAVYPAGRLSDKIGRQPIAVSAGLLGALGIIGLFFSQNSLHFILSGGFLGICGGAWMSSQWALATDLVGKREAARYLGLVNMSSAGAGVLSRLIGPVIDFFNRQSPNLGYQVMLLICFIFLIAGSLLLVKIKRHKLTEVA